MRLKLFLILILFSSTAAIYTQDPEGFKYLGFEGETVYLDESSTVAFGANGVYVYKYNVQGEISLTSQTFGDPIPNVFKFGYYKPNEIPPLSREEKEKILKTFVIGEIRERPLIRNARMPYYYYIPKDYRPDKTYSLLITYHGMGGSGKALTRIFSAFADEHDFIIISPNSVAVEGNVPSHMAMLWYEKEIKSVFNIHPKNYITGFSAGGMDTFIYANLYPERVEAFAINSSGYISDGHLCFSLDRRVPTMVTCGKEDPRWDGAYHFYLTMKEFNFRKAEVLLVPGVGHRFSKQAIQGVMDFFREVKEKGSASYEVPFKRLYDGLKPGDLAGTYTSSDSPHSDGEGDRGQIVYDQKQDTFYWKTDRGDRWSLIPNFSEGYLDTGERMPFSRQFSMDKFILNFVYDEKKGYTREIAGFLFHGIIYKKIR